MPLHLQQSLVCVEWPSEGRKRDFLRVSEFSDHKQASVRPSKEGNSMSFARKAVHWTKDDVRAAAAVLRDCEWRLDEALGSVSCVAVFKNAWTREEFTGMKPFFRHFLDLLDWDTEAAKSILIFVHEFRGLIEEAEQEEGATDAGSKQKADGSDSDR